MKCSSQVWGGWKLAQTILGVWIASAQLSRKITSVNIWRKKKSVSLWPTSQCFSYVCVLSSNPSSVLGNGFHKRIWTFRSLSENWVGQFVIPLPGYCTKNAQPRSQVGMREIKTNELWSSRIYGYLAKPQKCRLFGWISLQSFFLLFFHRRENRKDTFV